MKKYKVIKIIFPLLLIILLNNFSYFISANTLTEESLKKSIENVLTSQVKIETKSESGSSTITMGGDQVEVIVEDSKIKYISEQNITFDIDYLIEDGKCKFNAVWSYDNIENVEEGITDAIMAGAQFIAIQQCYIAVSDAMGIDNSLAYTYFSQQYDGTNEISNEIYTLAINEKENSIEFNLEINIEELAKLDSSKIDDEYFSTVTIIKVGNEEKEENTNDTEIDEGENSILDQDEIDTNEEKTNSNDNKNVDTTKATTIIPKAGMPEKIYVIIISLIIIIIVTYKKCKEYKDVK